MKTMASYLVSVALIGLNLLAQAETLLRCEGTSVKTIIGENRPSFFEECKRDMCSGEIVDFWIITESEAFSTDLPGEYKLFEPFDNRKEYGTVGFGVEDQESKPTGSLLQIKPFNGEYFLFMLSEEYRDNRQGMC